MWGIIWALVLQLTTWGQFLALKRTWLTVVIGLGVDLLILFPLLPLDRWLLVLAVIALSSIGIIARSLYNEYADHRAELDRARGGP
jgi:hypothetical protein